MVVVEAHDDELVLALVTRLADLLDDELHHHRVVPCHIPGAVRPIQNGHTSRYTRHLRRVDPETRKLRHAHVTLLRSPVTEHCERRAVLVGEIQPVSGVDGLRIVGILLRRLEDQQFVKASGIVLIIKRKAGNQLPVVLVAVIGLPVKLNPLSVIVDLLNRRLKRFHLRTDNDGLAGDEVCRVILLTALGGYFNRLVLKHRVELRLKSIVWGDGILGEVRFL